MAVQNHEDSRPALGWPRGYPGARTGYISCAKEKLKRFGLHIKALKSKSKLLLWQLSDSRTSGGRKTKTCFASSKPLLCCRLCQDISNGIWLRRNCSHFLL